MIKGIKGQSYSVCRCISEDNRLRLLRLAIIVWTACTETAVSIRSSVISCQNATKRAYSMTTLNLFFFLESMSPHLYTGEKVVAHCVVTSRNHMSPCLHMPPCHGVWPSLHPAVENSKIHLCNLSSFVIVISLSQLLISTSKHGLRMVKSKLNLIKMQEGYRLQASCMPVVIIHASLQQWRIQGSIRGCGRAGQESLHVFPSPLLSPLLPFSPFLFLSNFLSLPPLSATERPPNSAVGLGALLIKHDKLSPAVKRFW